MSSLSIQAKSSKIPQGWSAVFFRILDKKLRVADRNIKRRLLRDAREEHRYKHETYNLRNNTKVKGSIWTEKGILLKVNLNGAHYVEFIIRGTKYWKADPFIDEAAEKNESYIIREVEAAVGATVVDFNRIG